MHQALVINLAIVGVIILGIVVTGNPLFIMALTFLQNMPFVPPGYLQAMLDGEDGQDGTEEEGQPMGFTANIE